MRVDGIHLKTGIFRASRLFAGHAPFGVHSAGHYRLSPPFNSHVFQTKFVQLSWCVAGVGGMLFDGIERRVIAGQLAVYMPGMRHEWRPLAGIWDFYWLAMDGPLAEPIVRAYGLEAGVVDAGPPPRRLFGRLLRVMRRPSRPNELLAGDLAFRILTRAAMKDRGARDAVAECAADFIHKHWSDTSFNVKTLADGVGIDRSMLARRFRRAHGMAPVVYLRRLRMQNAMSLLQNTDLKIGAIARKCGFTDPNYFSRMIRQAGGAPPKLLRQRSRRMGHG